ncbi:MULTISPECIES: nitrate ABC transporter permease [Comamonas]|uniref:nitrate ABC transporter permease n=1 Tax=Comamonas TaxID=283 RepID=UPI0001DA6480|nr:MULTISPECIES: nitrate ABC transporter permease [Comamonas]EFI63326.1 nitrate ABC transporter, inner membrane subunit [Comamonas thiooxydans]TFF62359.1 nitrate ABC transporter, permease protein [Comamonas sp. A23]
MVSAVLHSPLELDPPHDPQLAAQAANDALLETSKEIAAGTELVKAEVQKDIKPKAIVKAPVAVAPSRLRQWAEQLFAQVLPPLLGLALLVGLWSLVSSSTGKSIPTPAETWEQALQVFSDPFYRNGPNDQGVGWNVLSSLQRVALGFGLAALVGIPLGFVIGRFGFLSRMFNPLISLLRPVSPLAWLPIGLLVFKGANPAAIWTIFICSIWPMVINTAVGVQRVPQDYMNVARVLNLSEWKIATTILFPAVLPYMLTGVRLAVGTAWLVIVAAEMLTGGVGIGFWVWDEWNNLNVKNIIIAIFVIGIVGLVLEWAMVKLASAFTFEEVKT